MAQLLWVTNDGKHFFDEQDAIAHEEQQELLSEVKDYVNNIHYAMAPLEVLEIILEEYDIIRKESK